MKRCIRRKTGFGRVAAIILGAVVVLAMAAGVFLYERHQMDEAMRLVPTPVVSTAALSAASSSACLVGGSTIQLNEASGTPYVTGEDASGRMVKRFVMLPPNAVRIDEAGPCAVGVIVGNKYTSSSNAYEILPGGDFEYWQLFYGGGTAKIFKLVDNSMGTSSLFAKFESGGKTISVWKSGAENEAVTRNVRTGAEVSGAGI